jgi:hypothetical protein
LYDRFNKAPNEKSIGITRHNMHMITPQLIIALYTCTVPWHLTRFSITAQLVKLVKNTPDTQNTPIATAVGSML